MLHTGLIQNKTSEHTQKRKHSKENSGLNKNLIMSKGK